MKIFLKVEKEFDANYLLVSAGVRYWEGAEIDGVEDKDGTLIPFKDGDYWCPLIDIEKGVIVGWPQGTTAKIHYKVCDNGIYKLLDGDLSTIAYKEGYVIDSMCPSGNGYGDYIIMNVNKNGNIREWNFYPEDFNDEED